MHNSRLFGFSIYSLYIFERWDMNEKNNPIHFCDGIIVELILNLWYFSPMFFVMFCFFVLFCFVPFFFCSNNHSSSKPKSYPKLENHIHFDPGKYKSFFIKVFGGFNWKSKLVSKDDLLKDNNRTWKRNEAQSIVALRRIMKSLSCEGELNMALWHLSKSNPLLIVVINTHQPPTFDSFSQKHFIPTTSIQGHNLNLHSLRRCAQIVIVIVFSKSTLVFCHTSQRCSISTHSLKMGLNMLEWQIRLFKK